MADSVSENIAALSDEDWGVREEAAIALGTFGDPRGVPPLIQTLKDSDRAVREAAINSLKALGDPALLPLGDCLLDPNFNVQEAAASILVTIGDHRVVPPLLSALMSTNWIVRMYAARALGRIADHIAINTLVLLLQDKVKAVRDEASAAITAIGEASVPQLLEGLYHSDWRIRLRSVETLGMLKSTAAVEPLLILLRQDPDTAVRQDTARALGDIGDKKAVEDLLAALKEEPLKTHAIEALGKIGAPGAVRPLLGIVNGLMTADYENRLESCVDDRYKLDLVPIETAVKALAKIGDAQAIPHLVKALQSTLIRAEAAEALTAFGQPAIPPLLTVLKKENDQNIRYHIKETLSRLGWRPGQIKMVF